jgi:hypothetical protein
MSTCIASGFSECVVQGTLKSVVRFVIVAYWKRVITAVQVSIWVNMISCVSSTEQLVCPVHNEILLVLLSRGIWVVRRARTRTLLLGRLLLGLFLVVYKRAFVGGSVWVPPRLNDGFPVATQL